MSKRSGTVRGRDQWAFDERILDCGEFVERAFVEQQGAAAMAAPPRSVAEIDLRLSQLLQRAATCCGTSAAEIASSSRRPAAIQGRTLVASWAVLSLGIGSNAVARFLGVSRQSVRRGLERAEQVLADLGCDLESLLGSIRAGLRLGDPA